MVEKVEMDVAMLTAGIKKRADVDEFRQKADDEWSDLRCEKATSGPAVVKMDITEAQRGVNSDLNTTDVRA